MEAGDGPRLAADRAGRMEGTDALCPASLPLSRRSVPSWGDGVRGGWGKGGIWKAGRGGELGPPRLGSAGTGCRLSTLPSVSLLSPPPFSFSLPPSSTANRKEENRVLIPPTPNLCQTPSPPHNSPHHTTTKPSVLSPPGSATFFHSPSPSYQNGCNVLKIYIHVYFKKQLKKFFFLWECPVLLSLGPRCQYLWQAEGGDPVLSWCP